MSIPTTVADVNVQMVSVALGVKTWHPPTTVKTQEKMAMLSQGVQR